jgi:hypothetical protein
MKKNPLIFLMRPIAEGTGIDSRAFKVTEFLLLQVPAGGYKDPFPAFPIPITRQRNSLRICHNFLEPSSPATGIVPIYTEVPESIERLGGSSRNVQETGCIALLFQEEFIILCCMNIFYEIF